jgi:ribose transport system ATP-binding protein
VLFAKWLRIQPRVLLLDEPTQGVDVATKSELHQHVLDAAEAGVAVVVSSSDVDELAAICSRVLVLIDGRIAAELEGEHITLSNISHESFGTGWGVVA